MKLSDEEVIQFFEWFHSPLLPSHDSNPPDVVRRVLGESAAARRRTLSPTGPQLVVLEMLLHARLGAKSRGQDPEAAVVSLQRTRLVSGLEDLGLIHRVTSSADFPDGLWRITDDGVDVHRRATGDLRKDPDHTTVGGRRVPPSLDEGAAP